MTADWRDSAACTGLDPSDFYPEGGPGVYADIDAAKAVCKSCLSRLACLEFAIANREQGVWGGTTEPERKRIIRDRKRNGVPVPPAPAQPLMPCGTNAALKRHQRRGEPIDDACRRAGALYDATKKEQRQEVAS